MYIDIVIIFSLFLQIGNQIVSQQIDKNYQEFMMILILSFGLRFIITLEVQNWVFSRRDS